MTDLSPIFRPRSVAVLGASARPGAIGREVVKNLINFEFQGKVFLVNPKRDVILSMKAYPSVLDIPDPVDMAVVIVPRDHVLAAVRECGEKGVKGLVIITAGFREIGGVAAQKEKELQQEVQRWGMVAMGPNTVGVINTDPDVRLNASFITRPPKPGNVALLSQSGSIGETIITFANLMDLRFSIFASLGNQMCVDSADLLEYLREDPKTASMLMYVESFRNPKAFVDVAKKTTRKKPVAVVKSGRTAAGARATFSHTGSLAGMDVSYDALFEECGILRAATVEELFDIGRAISHMKRLDGDQIGVITNAGGPGILATDALVAHGLRMAHFSESTETHLREHLNPAAAVSNPVDVVAGAGPKDYDVALRAVLKDPGVDAVLTILLPPVMIDAVEVARTIVRVYEELGRPKPMLTCLMGLSQPSVQGQRILGEAGLPNYLFPESAGAAMQALMKVGRRAAQPVPPAPERLAVDEQAARAVIQGAREDCRDALSLKESLALIGAYGIPVLPHAFATDVESALAAAAQVGFPLVLKLDEPGVVHKTEAGGVITDIRDEAALVRAFQSLRERLDELRDEVARTPDNAPCVPSPTAGAVRVVLQAMADKGHETILGLTTDPVLGPLLLFGHGGIYVEVFKDVTFQLHPVDRTEAMDMIRRIRGYALLAGTRGEPPVDHDVLADALARLSQLVGDFPEIAEMDINPFFATAKGLRGGAADARVRLG